MKNWIMRTSISTKLSSGHNFCCIAWIYVVSYLTISYNIHKIRMDLCDYIKSAIRLLLMSMLYGFSFHAQGCRWYETSECESSDRRTVRISSKMHAGQFSLSSLIFFLSTFSLFSKTRRSVQIFSKPIHFHLEFVLYIRVIFLGLFSWTFWYPADFLTLVSIFAE